MACAELIDFITRLADAKKLSAFVIGLPVREMHKGFVLETNMTLEYDIGGIPRWKKYVYNEDEAGEEGGRPSVFVDILNDRHPEEECLSEKERRSWDNHCASIRALKPEVTLRM